MDIKVFKDRVLLKEKRDVIRVHLYIKLLGNGIRPHSNDVEMLIDLYLLGGYPDRSVQKEYIQSCLGKNLKRSEQSVRNTLSKYTNLKVLNKIYSGKNSNLKVSDDYLPSVPFDKLVLMPVISHN